MLFPKLLTVSCLVTLEATSTRSPLLQAWLLGGPYGRSEEPQTMSQCEVKIPDEDDYDEKADKRHELVLERIYLQVFRERNLRFFNIAEAKSL